MNLKFDVETKELDKCNKVYLYGAGYICRFFLSSLTLNRIDILIDAVLVSNTLNNPLSINGIPVKKFNKEDICSNDVIILTVEKYEKILKELEEIDVKVLTFNQIIPYNIGIDGEFVCEWNNQMEKYHVYQRNNKILFKYIEIETINRCNGDCSFCPVNIHEKQREYHKMSEEMYKDIIEQLAAINYDGLVALFSNNEPFLDDRIFEFANIAREKLPEAFIYMYTNGKLIDKNKFKKIIDNLNFLQIDNYEPEKGKPNNISEIEELVHELRIEDKYRYFEIDKNTVRLSRGGNSPNSKVRYSLNAACCLPWVQLVIRPDGKISLCCNDALGENTLGDLTKESLLDIWFGDKYEYYRDAIILSRKAISTCKFCNYVDRRDIWGRGKMG